VAFLEQHRAETSDHRGAGLGQRRRTARLPGLAPAGPRPLSPRSLSQTLSAVRAFHRWLDRRLGIANSSIALVRGPRSSRRAAPGQRGPGVRPDRRSRPRSEREDWEVAATRPLLTLLYGCGLRISEALSLTRGDVPLAETVRITGKGGKTRIVPVLPIVREALAATSPPSLDAAGEGAAVPGQARRPYSPRQPRR
jgi:integrase/recombinase XerC